MRQHLLSLCKPKQLSVSCVTLIQLPKEHQMSTLRWGDIGHSLGIPAEFPSISSPLLLKRSGQAAALYTVLMPKDCILHGQLHPWPTQAASLAPQNLQIHKQKVAEDWNGEEDLLEEGEPGAVGVCTHQTGVNIAVFYWDLMHWGNWCAPALWFCCS